MKKAIFYITVILLFSACSNKILLSKEQINSSSKELANLIIQSSSKIDKKEAISFSRDITSYSIFLANKYEIYTHPLVHNTLVNLNLKQKGLCYHYANDLLKFIKYKAYKSFKFKKIVSKRNDYFEHSAIILTRGDISFKDSIVLDAWRDAGKLYFSKVKNDEKYKWELK